MGTQNATESEFNVLQFEKQLMTLKDSQEAINNCCQWCLQNRGHHKKIVNSWLNVLKRVKVEQRLILFYLANDVVQYSKRRNYEYVESWGTALQKATTMVRDDKVKNKILRIFKIWEQRSVYNEEFISDLCGLLSVTPTGPKSDEPHEFQKTQSSHYSTFQPSYVINKIKICTKLERDTDTKLKLLKEHNPKIQIDDGLIGSLKDRAHVDDVEKEVEVYVKHMEDYINALKLEIKNRITLISVLKQADAQLEADRKDVKVVANAYKMFGTRVKTFQRKLDEHKATLTSPIPSPDVNAPSPSPDSDIELPDEPPALRKAVEPEEPGYNPKADLEKRIQQQQKIQYSNAGFYNVATSEETPVTNTSLSNSFINSSFLSNGFSSYIGSDISVNLSTLEGSIFSTSASQSSLDVSNTVASVAPPPVPPVQQQPPPSFPGYGGQPLLPPPMPPFGKPDSISGQDYVTGQTDSYSTQGYSSSGVGGTTNTDYANSSYSTSVVANTPVDQPPPTVARCFGSSDVAPPFLDDGPHAPDGCNPYPPDTCTGGGDEEYNPEEDVSLVGWDGLGPDDGCFGLEDVASPYPDEPPHQPPDGCNPYPPDASQEYNPDEEVPLIGWDGPEGGNWSSQPPDVLLDTPESPPNFEKEGYGDPVEYRERDGSVVLDAHAAAAADVDHRVMPGGMGDHIDDSMGSLGGKDVDHRNLISLTGSPGNSNSQNSSQNNWNNSSADQDYRMLPTTTAVDVGDRHPAASHHAGVDHDYRMGFNLEQLKLPPPPPPPPSSKFSEPPPPLPTDAMLKSPPTQPPPPQMLASAHLCDNIDMDNIDMDLSDEDVVQHSSTNISKNENLKVIVDPSNTDSPQQNMLLEPPPPLPDLPDDVDANNFLDDLSNDLHEFENLSGDALDTSSLGMISTTDTSSDKGGIFSTSSVGDPPPQGVPPPTWQSSGQAPMLPPPSLAGFNDMLPMAMPPPPMGGLLPMQPPPQQSSMGDVPPSWSMEDEMQAEWISGGHSMDERDEQQSWQPPPHFVSSQLQHSHNGQFMQFGGRGRGINRGGPGFNKRGGRGWGCNRGGGNMMFRGGGVNSPRGGQKGSRGGPQQWNNHRGVFQRNFRGGF